MQVTGLTSNPQPVTFCQKLNNHIINKIHELITIVPKFFVSG